MSEQIKVRGNGLDIFDAFCVLFAALKLTTHPEWSWWFVFCPLLIQVALVLIGLLK